MILKNWFFFWHQKPPGKITWSHPIEPSIKILSRGVYSNSRRVSKEPADRNHRDRLNPKVSLLFDFSYNLPEPLDGFPLDVCLSRETHRALDTFFTAFSIQTCFKASLNSHWSYGCLLQF
jgi:hypothetical protein